MSFKFSDKLADWSYEHPHQATLLTLLGTGLFVLLNLVLNMWPMIIVLLGGAAVMLYLAIYGIFSGNF